MKTNDMTEKIIRAAIEVHRELGPGLLESVYERCLAFELTDRGFRVEAQKAMPIRYRGRAIAEDGYRIDLLVEGAVVIEIKSVEQLKPVHAKQLMSYLRLGSFQVGLLINFHEALLYRGIRRIVNRLDEAR